MATVTGVTAARAQEIQDESIVSATIVGNDLIFTKGDAAGTTVNAGRVIPPAYLNWPVGTIFMNTGASNPASLLGGGTWVRWGKGRMPISLDETNTRWDTPEETGGSETVTLSVTQIPSHNHGGTTAVESNDHTHTGYTSSDGNHVHTQLAPHPAETTQAGSAFRMSSSDYIYTLPNGQHTHSVQTYGVTANHTHAIPAQGGSGAHENMPPFIAVYMWKRTA